MRIFIGRSSLVLVTVLACSATASAGHRFGGRYHGPGGYGGSYSTIGRWGSLFPFSAGFGYSSFGTVGGLSYYHGPVGGYGPWGYRPYNAGYGYPTYFDPYYGSIGASYLPMAPVVVQTEPQWIGPHPADNPAIREWMPRAVNRDAAPAAGQPAQENVSILIKPSSPEALRKSIRYQAQGDEWFVKQNYLQAFARYKQAVSAARDRPEPRFRLGVALAALGEFDQAVDEFKRLVQLDPEWPLHGDLLDELFGEGQNLSKNSMLHRVAAWVRDDVRDPDRLFLLGVLLHFNEDRDKAKTLFETASLLASAPPHVQVFLPPRRRTAPAATKRPRDEAPAAEDEEPPVPRPFDEPPQTRAPEKRPAPSVAGPRLLPPGQPVTDAGRDAR
jgi:Tetratricopeptide repeat